MMTKSKEVFLGNQLCNKNKIVSETVCINMTDVTSDI